MDAHEQGQGGHVPDQHVPGPGSRGDVRSAGKGPEGLPAAGLGSAR